MISPLRKVVVYAASLSILFLFLSPMLWVINISLKQRKDIFVWPPKFFSFDVTFENYVNVLSTSGRFSSFILNSLIIAGVSTTVAVVVGSLAAFALSGKRKRDSFAWSYWMLSFRMMPPVALVIPYYVVFQQIGMLGSLWAVALTHSVFSIAIVIWTMKNFFDEIPPEIEEAAFVDGASRWQVFRLIALPISKAAVAASAIFAFLTSWNEFLFAVILSRSRTQTVPVAISSFVGEVYVSWGELAAATIVGILPALLFAFVGQRFLLIGLAPGAVK
ncbi:MAG TPA: carbohydrate ABC transporter permease [Methylomirabilota bacterium]|nr:carbohydrate ABC transporter permease [Methylomirabilota bacterium]